MVKIKYILKYLSVMLALTLIAILISSKATASADYNKHNIQQLIINEATKQQVDPSLALAIAKIESNFNPRALSHAGARGVMQIMPKTAEQEFGISRHRLYDAKTNIRIGIHFIKQLLASYNQRVDIALSHYNGGSAVKSKHGNLSIIPATKKYIEKVLATQLKFEDRLANENNLTIANVNSFKRIEVEFSNELINNLQKLRMHNATRGGKSTNYINNKFYLSHDPSNEITYKEKKVLEWESVFN